VAPRPKLETLPWWKRWFAVINTSQNFVTSFRFELGNMQFCHWTNLSWIMLFDGRDMTFLRRWRCLSSGLQCPVDGAGRYQFFGGTYCLHFQFQRTGSTCSKRIFLWRGLGDSENRITEREGKLYGFPISGSFPTSLYRWQHVLETPWRVLETRHDARTYDIVTLKSLQKQWWNNTFNVTQTFSSPCQRLDFEPVLPTKRSQPIYLR
jgi:hypothetical protein